MRTCRTRRRRNRWVVPLAFLAATGTLATFVATGNATPVAHAATTTSSSATGDVATPAGAAADARPVTPAPATAVVPITGGGAEEAGGAPVCRTSSLSVTLGTGTGTGTISGTVYRPLVFTNTGTVTCRVQGFPGVSHVAGDDGHQVGRAGAWVGSRGAGVDLGPGASAHSIISVTSADTVDPDTCRPTEVRGIRVYPPANEIAAYVPSPGISCSADIGTIRVRTISPGSGDLTGESGVADAGARHDLTAGGAR